MRDKDITDLRDQIVRGFAPQSVILFGSHASGTARADSDVDVLVVMPFDGSPIRKSIEISRKIRHGFPLDLIVRTPEYIEQRKRMKDPFILEILQKGRLLHDSAGA